jgi:hypothetical protein
MMETFQQSLEENASTSMEIGTELAALQAVQISYRH